MSKKDMFYAGMEKKPTDWTDWFFPIVIALNATLPAIALLLFGIALAIGMKP